MARRPKLPKHFVATGYVVKRGRTLLVYHKKLRMWLAPGGHIDAHETPEEAVVREIKEETGLTVEIVAERRDPDHNNKKVQFLYRPRHVQLETIDEDHQHIDLIYFCKPVNGEIRLQPNEHDAIRWYSLADLSSTEIVEEVRQTGILAIRELSAIDEILSAPKKPGLCKS